MGSLEIHFSRGSSQPRDQTQVFGIADGFFTVLATREALWHRGNPLLNIYHYIIAAATAAKSLQSCLTLCDPIDGSPPGSSVHGIFQARVLEWGAIAFTQYVFRNKPESKLEYKRACDMALTIELLIQKSI